MNATRSSGFVPVNWGWASAGGPILVFVTAIVLFVIATPWGIGTSPDSVGYIQQARVLSSGGGLASLGTQWPPLYPLVLAATSVFGDDPLVGARTLNALLFAANVVLFGVLAGRAARGNAWLAIIGSLLFLTAAPMLTVHAYAWSEALFLWLGFLGLFVLARYLKRVQGRLWIGAAVLFALAALTRFAGLPFILTGMLAIVLFAEMPLPARLRASARFGLVSALPLVLWLGWSVVQSGTAGNRTLAFHPIGRAQFWQAVFTVTGWLHLPAGAPGLFRVLLLAVLVLAAVVSASIWWRRREVAAMPAARTPFIWLALIFLPIYLGFLVMTISFLDANTPLDDRILAPVYVVLLALVVASVASAHQQAAQQRLVRGMVLVMVGAMVLLQLTSAVSWLRMHRQIGLGYSSPTWQQSPTVAAVRALPPDVVIFSNAPEAIVLLTERGALTLPRKNAAMLGEANAGYEHEIAVLQREVEAGAVIVYFDSLANRPVATPGELGDQMSLTIVQRMDDGAILGAGNGE